MTHIPAPGASLDLVTSGVGLIFAPDPHEMLTEAAGSNHAFDLSPTYLLTTARRP